MAVSPLIYDRVKETSSTTGTGTLTLLGVVAGYQSFAIVGNGLTCYYCIEAINSSGVPTGDWEVGIGTYTASGTTISRDQIIASSNANAAVSLSAGTKNVFLVSPAAILNNQVISGGRLTLASGNAVPTTDQTAKTNIFFTPHVSNRVTVPIGAGKGWQTRQFAELTLALGTLVNAHAYDVFIYDNAGTLTLESLEWANAVVTMTIAAPGVVTWTAHGMATGNSITFTTSGALPTGVTANTQYFITVVDANTFKLSTTRANVAAGTFITTTGSQSGTHTGHQPQARQTALVQQDGVWCKTGDLARLYLGSFFTTATTTTEDSFANRFVFNAYNRRFRPLFLTEGQDSWAYTTASWRQANANTANQFGILCGLAEDAVTVNVHTFAANTVSAGHRVAIGENSTSAFASRNHPGHGNLNLGTSLTSGLTTVPAVGYSVYIWIEYSNASGTTTFFGDVGAPTVDSSGMDGGWYC